MLGIISAYSIVAAFLFKISAVSTLANIYLQFFITFIPGLAFYTLIHKKNDHWLNIIALGYALGYGINIVEYFLLMPFGLGDYLKYFALLVSLLSAFLLVIKPIHCPSPKHNGMKEIIPALLFFILLAIDVVIYSGTNISPVLTGSSTYLRDIQYWVNTSVGLLLNFPPQAPYLSGFTLNYHYFSNIHIAFSSLVSNIDIFTLSFPLYPFTKSLLLIGSMNYLLDTFNATQFQKALLLIAILFSTGIERISIVTNFHHFHLAPFGLDIGFAFGAFFIASFTKRYRESDAPLDWPSYLVTMLFYAVLVGAKAPLAVVLSIFPGVVCLVWLFKKKFNYCFTYGVGIVAIFLTISIFCVGMFSVINNLSGVQRMQLYSIDKLLITRRFSPIYVNLIISIVYKTVTAQPLLVFLYAIACIKFFVDLIKKRLKSNEIIIQIALISTTFVSIVFSQIIEIAGTSEMYFMMAAYLPMAALGIDALTSFKRCKYPLVQKIYVAICLSTLVVQIYFFTFAAWGGYSAARSFKESFENITGNGVQFSLDTKIPVNSIQQFDVEGLIWIRENTSKDSLIAVDRATFSANDSNPSHYFYYAMFAERQMYIEGTSMVYVLKDVSDTVIAQRQQLIKDLFNNCAEAYEIIKTDGINYVIQTRWLTPHFQPGDDLTLVHSTESINIYVVEE